ncbi:YciI family protein [Arthrobacter sp. KK5.5]|uniref:YciI family protein n=1 Tax=Arthrobacter sp. KK5.5 TaxID=3373084 RepID=UPI003EE5C1B3
MTIFAVEYVYAAGTEAARDEHRPGHRSFLSSLKRDPDADTGVWLVASGPYADGTGALLIFGAGSESELLASLKDDPFNAEGLVSALRATAWVPVTGELSHHA